MTVNVEGLGKITATKDVLNEISIGFYSASKFHLIHDKKTLSERSIKIANEISDALNEEGYFEIGESIMKKGNKSLKSIKELYN